MVTALRGEPSRDLGEDPSRSCSEGSRGGGGAPEGDGSGTQSTSDGGRALFGLESSDRVISATDGSGPRGISLWPGLGDRLGDGEAKHPRKISGRGDFDALVSFVCWSTPREGPGGMEGLVRCLRASVRPDETSAALVAVLDGPASRVGPEGVESFVSLVAAHGAAASAGRAHARRTLVLAGGAVEPARYRAVCPNVVVVDLRSDPHGWVRDARAGSGVARGGGDGSAEGAWRIASHDLADVGALAATVARALGPMPEKGTDDGDGDGNGDGDGDGNGDGDGDGNGDGDGEGGGDDDNNDNDNNNVDGGVASTSGATRPKGRRSALHGRQPAASARTCVAVDCLAELVAHNGVDETMELVRSIRADPRVACVATYLAGGVSAGFGGHDRGTDSPLAAASLATRTASSAYAVVSAAPTLTLVPDRDGERKIGGGPRGGQRGQPDAVLVATHARPTGRGRSETDSVFTTFEPGGDSVFTTFAPASAAVMDALTDAMATARVGGVDGIGGATREGIGGGGIGAASSSSAVLAAEAEAEAEAAAARRLQASVPFNLGVNPSREEASAKASVVLPFEHQGAGRDYDEGNFLAYLPRDAGGARKEGGAGKARGHIMYVRDSDDDGEAPDSDEELDEDIDI